MHPAKWTSAFMVSVVASIDMFDPSLLNSLKDSDGQKDGDRAVQVISAHLEILSPDAPSGASLHANASS